MFERILTTHKTRKWEVILLVVIVAIGIFLRTYHFSDWLLFEIDQSYDTRIVSEAVDNGIGNLPLLGPTAGGGRALRLGPAFYYMEYASATIFGNTPTGHAMLILISSLIAIPLFYLFIRRYFTTSLSLALVTIFSMSVYLVLYGRFSWSPNILPFLILLSLYALLRSVSDREGNRDRWFLVATTAIALTSQIHFNAFFTIPTITVIFLLYKRPKFNWKTWIIAVGIVTLIYSPMILSDISTHGENISFFLKKVSKSGSSPTDPFKNFVRKSIVDLQYTASNYFFVNSGIDHINGGRIKEYGFQNDENLPWRIFAVILFLVELFFLAKNILKEKIKERKDFLVLIFLSIAVPFAYFYSLISSNFQIYPRFFLPLAPVAIILFGILLEKLQSEKNNFRRCLLVLVTIICIIPSMTRLSNHFALLRDPFQSNSAEREDIFPNDERLTQREQLAIADYIVEKQALNYYPVYINTLHEYEPVFWYHLTKKGVSYSDAIDNTSLYTQGNYFLIKYRNGGLKGIEDTFIITEKKDFGVLSVYTLIPKQENIKMERQSPDTTTELEQTTQIQELKTWNDVLDKQ